MNLKLLIDGIVRQTTILIAQLSTASGVRAPLAHVADQVFLDLAREIESQGIRRQVVADMFGLALRSYQKKMQRLAGSESERDRTLWEAVLELIEAETPTRQRAVERFKYDGERQVAAVLNDLVRSGLVYTSGAGNGAVYGLTSEAMRDSIQSRRDLESVAHIAWFKVFRGEALTRSELAAQMATDPKLLDEALEELFRSGRLAEREGKLASSNLALPLGAEHGWEAALLDHFRTVAVAIANKVRSSYFGSDSSDQYGGSTFTFTVVPGHPCERRVTDLLRKIRVDVQSLWDEVARHNEEHPPDQDKAVRVSFYLGQTLERSGDDDDTRR